MMSEEMHNTQFFALPSLSQTVPLTIESAVQPISEHSDDDAPDDVGLSAVVGAENQLSDGSSQVASDSPSKPTPKVEMRRLFSTLRHASKT